MCLTVDAVVAGNRERDRRTGFSTPPRLTLGKLIKFCFTSSLEFKLFV